MQDNESFRRQLNERYKPLHDRAKRLAELLGGKVTWYNGHYSKNEAGEYELEYFPIPVVEIKAKCDIEIGFEQTSLTTKLTRENALKYDFGRLEGYSFEAFGEEAYLEDYFTPGDSIESLRGRIAASRERNICFSFALQYSTPDKAVCELVELLIKDGFFY